MTPRPPTHARTPRSARLTAYHALRRIEDDGAYANLVMPKLLDASGLDQRDKAFATELVYGTTRMRRALDFAVDRFVLTPPDAATRTVLRLGAYQLLFAGTAAHAAVDATVALAGPRTRGFVNAILRKVSTVPVVWPSDAVRLSYPDWLFDLVVAELGHVDGVAALETMNRPADVTERSDGYIQDPASQWIAELVDARAGERVLDLCAAPGGKATVLAATGATVVAADVRSARVQLLAGNVQRLGAPVAVVQADGAAPPFPSGSFDRVLLDAPCSGLGVLRRRADARWRVEATDVAELAGLQRRLLDAAAPLVKAGGCLVYSVCTFTEAETLAHPVPEGFEPMPPPGAPWRTYGDGARILPHDAGTDGMTVRRFRKRS